MNGGERAARCAFTGLLPSKGRQKKKGGRSWLAAGAPGLAGAAGGGAPGGGGAGAGRGHLFVWVGRLHGIFEFVAQRGLERRVLRLVRELGPSPLYKRPGRLSADRM